MPEQFARILKLMLAVAACSGLIISPLSAQSSAKPSKRPNIVIILVDNMGYGDLGSYGGGELRGVPTPRLDRLAAEGLRLTNFNVEPECTPSRASLLTGRMPIRSGTSAVNVMSGRDGMSAWEYTLAELLSDAGYKTALFGKWHLGSEPGRAPTVQGFDQWYGISRSSDEALRELQPGFDKSVAREPWILEAVKGEAPRRVKPYDYTTRALIDGEITERSVQYIREQKGAQSPFFLLVSFTQPHSPSVPSPKHVKQGRSQFQNVLAEIDSNSGQILDALNNAGLDDETIVIFASDNGPESLFGVGIDYGGQSDSGPWRGEFPSAMEGAIRTPAIIRWPGRTQAGRVSNEIVSILDFYSTLAQAVGEAGRIPTDRPIDSIDQSAFLFGNAEKSAREWVMFFHNNEMLALKWRQFKVHFKMNEPATGSAVVNAGQGVVTGSKRELVFPWVFDLHNDPKELWNLGAGATWLSPAVARILGQYAQSVQSSPNIPPGADGPPGGAR